MSGTVGDNVTRGSGVIVAAAGGLPSGTKVAFFQASAPTGWTQDTSNNDKMLRVVSGSGGGTGGTAAISSPAHSISAAAHTLATSAIASHTHSILNSNDSGSGSSGFVPNNSPYAGSANTSHVTGSTGGGGSHTHSGTGSITTPAYMDVIIAAKD